MLRRPARAAAALLLALLVPVAACSTSGGESGSPTTGDGPVATDGVVTDEPTTEDVGTDVVSTDDVTTEDPDDDVSSDPTDDPVEPGTEITDLNYPNVKRFGDVSLAVPTTYELSEIDDDRACISPTDYAEYDFCDGIEIITGDALETATNGNPYDGDQGDFAWYGGSDVPFCNPVYDEDATVTASTPRDDGTREVGGEEAEFRSWDLTCSNGASIEVFQWYLPDAGVLFSNRGGSIMNPIVLDHVALG